MEGRGGYRKVREMGLFVREVFVIYVKGTVWL